MQDNFLKEIVTIVVGKQAEKITDLLDSDKYVNEFIIAKKLDLTINQTRNILYKLADQGLVSSIRKKDKKKGWYTYFWKLENFKALLFLEDLLQKKIEQVKNQIKSRESKVFYVCENCNIEYTEDNAIVKDFTCDECGKIFTLKDNTKVLKELRRNFEKFEAELASVKLDTVQEREKSEKKKLKEIKKEKKTKDDDRAKKREERKIERDKQKSIDKGSEKKSKKNVKKKIVSKKSGKSKSKSKKKR